MSSEQYMMRALELAELAFENGDIPVGCVIVKNDEIIGEGYNQVEITNNPTNHAEIIAINEAVDNNGYKHLNDCEMYVTLEPCSMCAGAIVLSRIEKVYFAANDNKTGAAGSIFNILNDDRLNHRCEIESGLLGETSSDLIKLFFKKLRNKKT